ncbi:hypothetical protein, partial [Streptomyces mesophilus]|uniref:hypothetical protein n=1 Tax=Streptomyces mesophilus TaxID=1775132 RepID=UPI0033210114
MATDGVEPNRPQAQVTWRGRVADGVLAAVVCALVVATAPDGAAPAALALAAVGSLALAGYRP